MSVLHAEDKDIPELVKLVNASYRGMTEVTPTLDEFNGWSNEAHLVSGPRILPDNPHELRSSDKVAILKYEEDGKIFGCVRVEQKAPEFIDMSTLSVWPHLQAKGIGSKLATAAEHWARDRGCSKVKIHVITQRKELVEYYKRRGYKEAGVRVPFEDVGNGIATVPDLELTVLTKKL